ncbi:DEAD/DEAH box helicase [Pseudahrensia aquimaris]|uniref:DEAD/DEAH box helicase n=1 Tax=Pseudahrensia aquimaris TaxID=744461 RepID=A0ABW3FFS5_9HYPH
MTPRSPSIVDRATDPKEFDMTDSVAPDPVDIESTDTGPTDISALGIAPPLAKAITERGYSQLTPVQSAILDPALRDADLLVSAQTGSGKTVAFGMAIAPTLLDGKDRLDKPTQPLALVVAPTRELALQVKRELDWLYAKTGAVIVSTIGGMDIRAERRDLQRGAHIVVGTPGRLRDHISRHAFDPKSLRAVVLDEADEMLDLGFRDDLEFILEQTPEERRTLLFSATVPAPIIKLAKNYQRDAVRVSTQQERDQHGDIEYRVLVNAPRERENAIINVLRYYDAENALVFCNTRATVNHMVARFNNRGFAVVALSGELSQDERTRALQSLRDGRASVCIATDVAARGIDLPKLELVIHADLPSNPETLLHRSGRTGRAGRKGVSVLMAENKTRAKAERLLRFAKLEATWANPPSADEVNLRDEERLMADTIFTDPAGERELEFTERLLERFTPQQIATAFLRQRRAEQSAPEDIEIVSVNTPTKRKFEDGPAKGQSKQRQDFENSVWMTLSVGRKQNAEPRWLIPLLCNAGNISKRDIGFIKIQQGETHIELDAEKMDDFVQSIGPKMTLEKNVRVTIQENKPEFEAYAPNPKFKKPYKGNSDNGDERPRPKKAYGSDKPKKPFKAKERSTETAPPFPDERKPKSEHRKGPPVGKPVAGKPAGGKPGKKLNKKAKARLALAAQSSPAAKPTASPRPKKKPKKAD